MRRLGGGGEGGGRHGEGGGGSGDGGGIGCVNITVECVISRRFLASGSVLHVAVSESSSKVTPDMALRSIVVCTPKVSRHG